ncbi:MAG: hypothetical protein KDC44_06635, partial [Phaeodactylibacter sp.]|nr:hypothetical protein [Phaeodactylibacter sp.]
TYLRVFVEPHLADFKWETRLDSLRKLSGKQQQGRLSSGITSNEFILVRGIGLIVLVALLINFVQFVLHHEAPPQRWQQLEFVNVLVSTLIGIVVFAVFFLTARRKADELKRNGRVETEFYESWLAVQQAEVGEAGSE